MDYNPKWRRRIVLHQLGRGKCCRMLLKCSIFCWFPWKALCVFHYFDRSASTFSWGVETEWVIAESQTFHNNTLVMWNWGHKGSKIRLSADQGCVEKIVDDAGEKGCVRCEVEGLLKQLSKLGTAIYIIFWDDILQTVDVTNKNPQHAKLDTKAAGRLEKTMLNQSVTALIFLKVKEKSCPV